MTTLTRHCEEAQPTRQSRGFAFAPPHAAPTATRPCRRRTTHSPGSRHEGVPLSKKAIDEVLRASVEQYFKDLRGAEPGGLHALFLGAAEKPLLDVVLRHAEGNQSRAADWLGINRNTLRRKLLDHKLIK